MVKERKEWMDHREGHMKSTGTSQHACFSMTTIGLQAEATVYTKG